ncbi:MAG: glycerate kinase [Bacillota bacterium]|nr:glycerate kinase [Bacillota bacterium]HOB91694.1 glycerate kinase [Bacillota bacterium]HPZ54562.1 glycerate kinase [Bacillota bacterium]HQD18360.1 glycerate kinase [Bacillota bacterium]
MRILIAPDSFKGCLTALEVGNALKDGILSVCSEAVVDVVPMADGGEGTVRSLVDASSGKILTAEVLDPLGRPVTAEYGIMGDGHTAVIEMAAASGLPLLKDYERNPRVTSTYGTGQLIEAALDAGATKLIVGIGGSATNDGGAGMAQALGARLLDRSGNEIQRGGAALKDLAAIDVSGMDSRLSDVEIIVACDVTNPLTGPKGATAVYGRQKGATEEMIEELDRALANYARVIREQLHKDVEDVSGAGAAGGLGAGMLAFLNAALRPGVDIVIEATRLADRVTGCDLVITGEGRLDSQTSHGKTPMGVARVARAQNVPVVGVAGQVAADAEVLYDLGFSALVPIADGPMTLEESFERAGELLRRTGARIMRLIGLGASYRQA